LCWTNGSLLPSEYAILGEGDCREISSSGYMQSVFQSIANYRAQGDRLHELIMDCLTNGSDVDGATGPVPIVPDTRKSMDLLMPGHGCVLRERLQWGKPTSRGRSYTTRLKQLLRVKFQSIFNDSMSGKLRDSQHHRRVLDFWCDKYGVDDWTEFVPTRIQSDIPGRLKHETTVSDDFDRADAATLGAGWSVMIAALHRIISNQASGHTSDANNRSRYDSDLSSDDATYQCDTVREPTTASAIGILGRCASAADTAYAWRLHSATAATRTFGKYVAGTLTTLSSDTTAPPAVTFTPMLSCNGSAQKVYLDAVEVVSLGVTDTSITSGLRGGMAGRGDTTASERSLQDNFTCSDIGGGGGVIYTQLERNVRGVSRGVYSQSGG